MRKFTRFVAVASSLIMSTALIGGIAFATPTVTPTLISPDTNGLVVSNVALNYSLPETPSPNSVTVTLSRTSPATPSFTRTMVMSNDMTMNLSIDIFAAPNTILGQNPTKITAINPPSDILPVGVYTVSLSYQNSIGGQAATVSKSLVTFTIPCDVGSYSNNGNVPVGGSCTLAPSGRYVSITGQTSSTICPAGFFAIDEGSASCLPAPAGKFSTAGNGNVAPSECAAGTYQPTQGQSECLQARAGHYVSDTGQITDLACPLGTYRLELGQASCLDAPAGTYVSETGAQATSNCLIGTFSANARSTSCALAQANFYVDTVAATSATACPSGYTSPAGSDASSDCVAPVVTQTTTTATTTTAVTKPLPTLAKGKKMKIKTLATQIEMSLPARSRATAKVAKSSRKICKVSGNSIKALKQGACVVTVKVKPKKGSATTKATTITIN